MITSEAIERFLHNARGQARREGHRYAAESRVLEPVGTGESVNTIVRGAGREYEVVLWAEGGTLAHRCSCPSWRDPCKHEVAVAVVLQRSLAQCPLSDDAPSAASARANAVAERIAAAKREKLRILRKTPPFLRVEGGSGFSYRVQLRGNIDGPHSCDCPDFEANRLHTCKHVESARAYLKRSKLPPSYSSAANRARVFLHFGEVVEPRLWGVPQGRGARMLKQFFDDKGVLLRPLEGDDGRLRDWLATLGSWVEPAALQWLDRRIERHPALPEKKVESLIQLRDGSCPYPYQWEGAAFLARRGRALLADEMGLGKTVQAILAAAALRSAERPARAVTIVCPASLRGGWRDEIARWLGDDALLLEGSPAQRSETITSRPAWLITHFEQILRDFRFHAAQPPDLLIIDEAQRAKGLNARTARVLKAIDARYLFALTGTPLENRLEEAYTIAQLVDQRLLPPLWQIERDHFVRDHEGGGPRVLLYRNLHALRSHLAPAFLRRRKEDVALELPARVRSVSKVPMHPAVCDTYEDMMAQVARIASQKVIRPADLERMQRLLLIARRCCDGPHMLGMEVDAKAVPKLIELEQTLRDLCLGEGRKAVVFSEWTDMTDAVESLCDRMKLPPFHLHGSVPLRQRPGLIRTFIESKGPAVFISTDAGGVGLNLQAADIVVNLDLPWNPARLEQRVARVHRIGSKRTVQEIIFVAENTIEERILKLHEVKKNVLANIWSKGGEDTIAAPGGSGAFREMVGALLDSRKPIPTSDGSRSTDIPSGDDASEKIEADLSPPSTVSSAPAAAELPATVGVNPSSIDPNALAAAVAAVAPTLPIDHRKSLAIVFRALANALDS